jgi:hypothetical protein
MEETRKCFYCNEIMIYGEQPQVLCKSVIKTIKNISKTVKFIYYGWACSMKDDDCDIVFDEKDTEKNNFNYNQAEKELLTHISIEC